MENEILTIEAIQDVLKEIKQYQDASDEVNAFIKQEALFATVLQFIGDGLCSDPAACAREALKSEAMLYSGGGL
jgi:hypothetical protein